MRVGTHACENAGWQNVTQYSLCHGIKIMVHPREKKGLGVHASRYIESTLLIDSVED